MKDLDIYASRQAYTFPFCPKVYKYVIDQNCQNGNECTFDVSLLIERVPFRLKKDARLNSLKTIKMLSAKVIDIIEGFSYLYRRYGGFEIRKEMIGWTALGFVKVWLNEDFGVNEKQQVVEEEQTMVLELVRILSQNGLLPCTIKKSSTFKGLINNMTLNQTRTESQILKKQVSFGMQHLNPNTKSNCIMMPSYNKLKSPESKKNITFSYSNKDLNLKVPVSPNHTFVANKRVSIQIDPNQINTMITQFNDSNQHSGMKIQVKSPTASSAKGYCPGVMRSERKKFTYFKSDYGVKEHVNEDTKMKKLKEHFSKTTQSSVCPKQVPSIDKMSKQLKENRGLPEFLHHSTSSNPLSKFFKGRRAQSKTYSSKGSNAQNGEEESQNLERSKLESNESEFSQSTLGKTSKEVIGRAIQTFKIEEEQVNLRQSQEVQKDLDALFGNSDKQLDYDVLENQLDCIL